MLLTRIKTALVLLLIGLSVIYLNSWFYFAFIAITLLLASKEYYQIYQKGGYSPFLPLILIAVFLLILFRYLFAFTGSDVLIALTFLIAMAIHTFRYELGKTTSAIDLALTLGAVLYFGWIGGYFISIISLAYGQWWLLLTIAIIAISDSGAFFIGRRFGKRKLAPKTSPGKTWEGYFGGVFFGIIGGILVGLLFNQFSSSINATNGFILGLVLSVLTPLGDLGESMIKRQFGIKDSSNLLPGHGGAMDRIDTWIWGVCLSYYLIIWFF